MNGNDCINVRLFIEAAYGERWKIPKTRTFYIGSLIETKKNANASNHYGDDTQKYQYNN